MNLFDTYTKTVLLKLNEFGVKYIVIGGYAVNYYGFRRTTGDIDLWIKPENGNNKEKLLAALGELGIPVTSIERLKKMDFTKPQMFVDGKEPFKIDFLTNISRVKFDEAWEQKNVTTMDGVKINFLHLNHLIVSKIATGRPQDKIDIEELQKIQAIKNKKK